MTSHFSTGDIIQGNLRGKNESFHPIIYFKECNEEFFEGGMITHYSGFGNISLLDEHFNKKINDDTRPSYFVKNYLFKKHEWGPFYKIGELSPEGLKFVQSQLVNTIPKIWENFTLKM
jgi:hypothetical protein